MADLRGLAAAAVKRGTAAAQRALEPDLVETPESAVLRRVQQDAALRAQAQELTDQSIAEIDAEIAATQARLAELLEMKRLAAQSAEASVNRELGVAAPGSPDPGRPPVRPLPMSVGLE